MHRILKEERDLVIDGRPLEATAFQVANIRMAYVLYESGRRVVRIARQIATFDQAE